MGNEFSQYLREQGTTRQLTVHDSPSSNGIAERCNGVLIQHVRAMLIDSGLPKFLWLEAMKFAMWIRNRTTTHALKGKTPYEALYGITPVISNLHLWGSRIWVCSLTAGKLDPRGQEGHFVGYDSESKGYRVYWTDSRTVGVEQTREPLELNRISSSKTGQLTTSSSSYLSRSPQRLVHAL